MIPGLKKRTFTLHDLVMYFAIAIVHIRLMILLGCLSLLGGLGYFVYAKAVYTARSIVRVDYLALPMDSDSMFHDSGVGPVASQLVSTTMSERTARQFGITDDYKGIARKYIKKIAVKGVGPNNLEIQVWGYSLDLTRKWAEVLVQEYLKSREELRISYNETLIKAYKNEISQFGERIESSFGQRFDFRTSRGITEVMIELDRMRGLPQEIAQIKHKIGTMTRVRKQMEDPSLSTIARLSMISEMEKDLDKEMQLTVGEMITRSGDGGEKFSGDKDKTKTGQTGPNVVVVPAMTSQSSSGNPWDMLEKEQRRIQNEIEDASAIYLPGHKKIVALTKELEEVQKKLEVEYQVTDARFELEYEDLLNKLADLEAKMPQYQEVIKKYERVNQDYQLQQSGELAWNALYTQAAQKISTVQFAGEKERITVQYSGLIEAKSDPISPNRTTVVLGSILIGLGLAIGVAFLIEFLDHTISNIEEVESTFQIRGLGIIPQVDEVDAQHPILMDSQDSQEKNLLENFRVIRTNIISMGALSKQPQVMMVTSAMPKEGKTVVSSNLAISFAQMGSKTLLIDTDLRRGRLHRLFGLRKGPGLSNLLLEKSTMDEAIRPSGKENLSVLTAGQHLDSGSELLGSPRFAEIMREVRTRYDRILVDTPPVLGLSETSVLQPQMDGVLFVVWGGHTPIRSMKTAVEALHANGANFYGFILNRLDLSATTNYYQYYYYSNDYYHNYHALENA